MGKMAIKPTAAAADHLSLLTLINIINEKNYKKTTIFNKRKNKEITNSFLISLNNIIITSPLKNY